MTQASFDSWFQRYGPVGFILRYSLTITATVFLIWNLLIACTDAGLSWYWTGPLAHFERGIWPVVYFASLMAATRQWFLERRKRSLASTST